jgi:hypothetical protein
MLLPAPLVTATPVTVTGEVVEVLVRVTVPVPVRGLAPAASVIVKGLGVIETVPRGTPVPLRATGEPVIATLPPIVSVAFTKPFTVGVNTTLMVQVAAAASVAPHVPPAAPAGREYRGEEKVRVMPVSAAPPAGFDSVNVWEALAVVVTTLPKAKEVGETVGTVTAGATYSTAPISTDPLAFRFVPRMSSVGASA